MSDAIIAVLIVLAAVGCYALGYSDGKLEEREAQDWKRMDELIAKVRR
jgi:hypothetical protein